MRISVALEMLKQDPNVPRDASDEQMLKWATLMARGVLRECEDGCGEKHYAHALRWRCEFCAEESISAYIAKGIQDP